MRTIKTLVMLAAMAAAALAQDPNRNRMNDQFPEVRQQETVQRPSAQGILPSAFENRMNVRYQEGTAAELTGGPNPYGNRMNVVWPKAQPKPVEKSTFDPAPSP